ncbi:MAG TPA: class I SAM-dependent methyltransferase [Catalimonadaceae bacterium]|nr:class I SAM-dependent methyltransferase [Catalimonadaceae bacterium]HPI11037.1 class I SAM-dependent methyltransferase [Catalimonadaceae bacterium]
MDKKFSDNFSAQSEIYARYRPSYPDSLFQFLATCVQEHKVAWDCGTGNGQAAIQLANYFHTVVATEPSENQLRIAVPCPGVEYRCETAETNSLPDGIVDLITVANAMHWFDFEKFFIEVRRVLKPNGILAAWAYSIPTIDPETDKILRTFHDETVGEFWVYPNHLVEQEYKTIPFPFEIIESPSFISSHSFSRSDLLGYLNSWSAVQKFIRAYNRNPAEDLVPVLSKIWPDEDQKREVIWKLIVKIGKV